MSILALRTVRSKVAVLIWAIMACNLMGRLCVAQSADRRISPALLERTSDMSLYELSNARLESNEKQETVLVLDFQIRQKRLLMAEHVVLRIGNEPSG